MFKWLKKLCHIIDNYDIDMNYINVRIEDMDDTISDAETLIRNRTDVSAKIRPRGPSTIIVTGVYNNKDFVEIYDIANEDLTQIMIKLNDMKRHHKLKIVEGPFSVQDFLNTTKLKD